MAVVHFFGAENVIGAAENLQCPTWALFTGRNMFCKYEGTDIDESIDLLSKNLEALAGGGTAAIYTLKFYELNNGKPPKISEKTVCDCGSFNFKLTTEEERKERYIGNFQNQEVKALQNKIEELEQKLIEKYEEEEEEEEPETIGSLITNTLKDPEKTFRWINVFRAMAGQPELPLPASIGNIFSNPNHSQQMGQQPQVTNGPQYSQDQQLQRAERLGRAIDTLEKNDPQLLEHLEQLAQISVNNPGKFQSLLSMLNLF